MKLFNYLHKIKLKRHRNKHNPFLTLTCELNSWETNCCCCNILSLHKLFFFRRGVRLCRFLLNIGFKFVSGVSVLWFILAIFFWSSQLFEVLVSLFLTWFQLVDCNQLLFICNCLPQYTSCLVLFVFWQIIVSLVSLWYPLTYRQPSFLSC